MKKIIFALIFSTGLCALSGCNQTQKTLTNLSFTTNKTVYTAGEFVNRNDLAVTAYYSDQTYTLLTNEYSYTPSGALTENDKRIAVEYLGFVRYADITVNGGQSQKIVTSLSFTANKTVYAVGEYVNRNDLVVTAYYSDQTYSVLTNEYSYLPSGALTTNDKKIVVEYSGFTKTVDITVSGVQPQKTLSSLSLSLNKTDYYVGDTIAQKDIILTANYSDSTSEKITSGFTWTPNSALKVTDTKCTVTYKGLSTSANIKVTEKPDPQKTLTGLTVTGAKTSYTEGEYFDTTNLVVKANYSDKSGEEVNDYTVSITTPLKTTDTKVRIQYKTVYKDIAITVKAAEPFTDLIEWVDGVTLQVPNGSTWYRKRKLTGGQTYYMRRHSGSQSFYISAEYPDGTFLEGYEEKYISATTITSWSFCIAKTSWVKFTIKNANTSSGQTSIYWYDY